MIGDLFFSIIYWFANTIINMFPPSGGFPPEALSSAKYIGGYFGMFSPLISMPTLLTCITLVFTVEIAVYGFRTLKWVISHLPFIGGRG
jgi:hypothetical protein